MTDEKDHLLDIHFHKRHVPLPLTLLVFFLFIGLAAIGALKYRESISNYQVFLTSPPAEPVPLIFGSWPALENPQFFNDVKNRFINTQSDFIEIDLSAMQIRLYDDGIKRLEAEVVVKGKEGWLSETPAGLYRVEDKYRRTLSTFARVYMPWAVQFHGNYYIHGLPYRPDGTPLAPRANTGGCVQLEDKIAKTIFEAAPPGTPVLVFEKGESDNFEYQFSKPAILALKFLAADLKNNFVLISQDAQAVVPLGALTKLMTGMAASEFINFSRKLTVPKEAIVKTFKPRLRPGQVVSTLNLLFPLLMESSNEAALTYAHRLGKDRLLELMNRKAESLGMSKTRFVDILGEDPQNVSTAEDLFRLLSHIWSNRSFLLAISSGKFRSEAYGVPIFSNLQNYNGFDDSEEFLGGKISLPEEGPAGMLAVFEIAIAGVKRPIAIITLESPTPKEDIKNILDWIKTNF